MNENEPRVPAGQPGGGEWTDGASKFTLNQITTKRHDTLARNYGMTREQIASQAQPGPYPAFHTRAEAESAAQKAEQADPGHKVFVQETKVDFAAQKAADRYDAQKRHGTYSFGGNVKGTY